MKHERRNNDDSFAPPDNRPKETSAVPGPSTSRHTAINPRAETSDFEAPDAIAARRRRREWDLVPSEHPYRPWTTP